MRILIAGATGAIGRPSMRRLRANRHEVFALTLRASGADAVYYATRLRGASNEKAERELEFRPRPLEWL